MKNAFEYEAEYEAKGRRVKKRLCVGPVLISALVEFALTMTGHTIWSDIAELCKVIRRW